MGYAPVGAIHLAHLCVAPPTCSERSGTGDPWCPARELVTILLQVGIAVCFAFVVPDASHTSPLYTIRGLQGFGSSVTWESYPDDAVLAFDTGPLARATTGDGACV